MAIGLKDGSKGFPLNQSLGVLKWRFVSQNESAIPLSVNCWPTPNNSGGFDVNIEYQLERSDIELKNVSIIIPIPYKYL